MKKFEYNKHEALLFAIVVSIVMLCAAVTVNTYTLSEINENLEAVGKARDRDRQIFTPRS